MAGLVTVVIPLRDVYVVEKVESNAAASNILPNALLITTKGKVHFSLKMTMSSLVLASKTSSLLLQTNFLFAQLRDRELILEKVSDFLAKQKTPKRY